MPPASHDSNDDPDRPSGRDDAQRPDRGSAHDLTRDPYAGEPDEVVTVEHVLAPGAHALPAPSADYGRYAYVLDGQVVALIGGQTLIVGPGSIVALPRGYRYSLHCAGDTAARVLVVRVRAAESDEPREGRAA
jgi:quercetin dioxygenase-like cupin family protein